jgi:import inner membrane translocase subunit TIM10
MSVGETVCADRCAAKYWQVVAIVGTLLGAKK